MTFLAFFSLGLIMIPLLGSEKKTLRDCDAYFDFVLHGTLLNIACIVRTHTRK